MRLSYKMSLFAIFLLWIAGLTAAAQFSKIAVPFDLVQATYPNAGASIGWLLTLISALGAVFGMVAGTLAGHIGSFRILIAALCLGAACSLWQATLPALPLMMLARLIEGLSHLGIVVAAPTLIAQISPDRLRGAALSLWSTFFGVSFALTAWLGLPLTQSSGLEALFLSHASAMAALAIALFLILKGAPLHAGKVQGADRPPLSVRNISRQHVQSYSSPYVSAASLGWVFYTLTFVSLLTLLPPLLPTDTRTAIVGAMPLASILVSLVCVPLLLTRITAVRVVSLGFCLSVLVLCLLPLGMPVGVVAVALFATLGLVQGATFAAVPQLNSSLETRALANGALAQMGNIGNLLGTPILLILITQAGPSLAFTCIAALYALGALTHEYLNWLRRRRGQTQSP
ncbi:MFS transporter [Shimia abyssi]|uniref:Putative MFS family arabinose efflux permease n=1 Tax=Shimia abyssi TaxID=1662395 RepID=A0A2P8FFH3_9RHOB|nr:MFS transporter [Shimia abyssi]PSL20466.1 putative MFS family arabinose efflux permease [Shimia abyssi]